MKNILISILAIVTITSCSNNKLVSDGSGSFEADDILVSSKGQGELMSLNIQEGKTYKQGEEIGLIDTTYLHIQKTQLYANKQAVQKKAESINAQKAVVLQEINLYSKTLARITKLNKKKSATAQQLDEANGRVNIAKAKAHAFDVQKESILKQLNILNAQIQLINNKINDYKITCPITGVILNKYKLAHENVAPGTLLFKIAPLDKLTLKVYVDGETLRKAKLGADVKVLTDSTNNKMSIDKGTVSWISSEAEFTPKIIQTRKERVKFVYAVKVIVNNKEGKYKIGMPGEVIF